MCDLLQRLGQGKHRQASGGARRRKQIVKGHAPQNKPGPGNRQGGARASPSTWDPTSNDMWPSRHGNPHQSGSMPNIMPTMLARESPPVHGEVVARQAAEAACRCVWPGIPCQAIAALSSFRLQIHFGLARDPMANAAATSVCLPCFALPIPVSRCRVVPRVASPHFALLRCALPGCALLLLGCPPGSKTLRYSGPACAAGPSKAESRSACAFGGHAPGRVGEAKEAPSACGKPRGGASNARAGASELEGKSLREPATPHPPAAPSRVLTPPT